MCRRPHFAADGVAEQDHPMSTLSTFVSLTHQQHKEVPQAHKDSLTISCFVTHKTQPIPLLANY